MTFARALPSLLNNKNIVTKLKRQLRTAAKIPDSVTPPAVKTNVHWSSILYVIITACKLKPVISFYPHPFKRLFIQYLYQPDNFIFKAQKRLVIRYLVNVSVIFWRRIKTDSINYICAEEKGDNENCKNNND